MFRSLEILFILSFFLPATAIIAQSPASVDQERREALAAFEEGQNYHQRGDLNAAINYYTIAIKADANLFQAYYQRAVALQATGKNDAAEADLAEVIKLQPGFARAYRLLGLIKLDRGQAEQARDKLARAIELDQKMTGVRVYLASALLRLGQPELADQQLSAALEQGEQSGLIHALLGVARERMGKTDAAFAAYSKAVELEPANAVAREGRGRMFEAKGEIQRAIEEYTLAYRAQPSVEVAKNLAELHARAGQSQAAVVLYRGLVHQHPADLKMRARMLQLMADSGQGEEAMKEIAQVAAAHPRSAELLVLAGDLNFKEKPDVAADYYRRALDIAPADNRARVQLGAALVRSMQYEAALPVLNEALAREPNNYAAHANLATAFFKLKSFVEAAREFIWIIRARPETAVSYYFLAISFDRLGDCEQATRAYQEFVRRADAAVNKNEVEESNTRLAFLQRLAKQGRCKSLVKENGK
jgi:tetratricopeptide (TPR) repeat protein